MSDKPSISDQRTIARREDDQASSYLAAIVESSEDAIIGKSLDGTISSWNAAAERLYGYAADEAVGRPVSIIVPPERRDELSDILARIRRGEPIQHHRAERVHKDGTIILVSHSVSPVRDANGKVVGAAMIARDITEQARADEDLRNSDRLQRLALGVGRIGAVEVDLSSGHGTWTPELNEIWGMPDDFAGNLAAFCWEHVHPDDLARVQEESAQLTQIGEAAGMEFRIIRTDGEMRWIRWLGQVIEDADTGLPRALGVNLDVTENKRAEDQVRAASLYARSLIEVNLYPLVTISPEGKITDVNKATEEATGIPRDRLIGTDLADYFTEPDKARAGYQRVLEEGFVRDYPLVLRNVSGSLMDVEYDATVHRDEAGELQGVFAASRDVTESKKARMQLARLAAIVTSSDDAIFSKDLDGTITSWNAAAEGLHGYSAEEAIGRSVAILMPPGREGEAQELIERVLHEGQVTRFETQRKRKDGSLVDVELRMSPIHDSVGDIVAVSVIGHDITERVRAERERRQSEEKFAAAFHASPDLISITRLSDGTILEVNEGFSQLLSYAHAEIIGKNTPELSIWADPADRATVITSLEESGQINEFETTLRCKDGTLVTGIDSARTIEFQDEPCFLSVIHDITERKQAEDQVRAASLHARSLVEANLDPLVTISPEGKITDVNEATVRVIGVPHETLIGTDFSDYFTEPDKARASYREVLKSGQVRDYPLSLRHVSGSVIDVEYNATVYRDEAGEVVGVFAAARDVTERKAAAKSLETAATQWRETFDAMRDSVALLDASGKVVRCNAGTVSLAGRGYEEIIGRSCHEVFHGALGRLKDSPEKRARHSLQSETNVFAQDGHWLRVTFQPQRDAAGGFTGGVHVVSDITKLTETEQQLQRSLSQLQAITEEVIAAIADIVEVRDPYTAGHERRVAELALAMATQMGLDEETVTGVRVASLLHDVGKITVPTEILSKPGRLSEVDFQLIRTHPQASHDVLHGIEFPWPVAEVALQHHERLDGSGYPRGLAGDEIILEARILAVADVVEAMASHRPYRPALGIDAALEEIEQHSGGLYDAQVTEACVELFRRQGFTFAWPGAADGVDG